jgi:nonribosomal peptide synthetase protein BlmVII
VNAVDALLAELRERGATLTVAGDDVRCAAPRGVLTPQLVERLRAAKPELLSRLRFGDIPRLTGGPTVLSSMQERMWLQTILQPEDTSYHLPLRLDLSGELRPAALRQAFTTVRARHEVLRTGYVASRGRPKPVLFPPGPVPMPLVDLSGLPAARRSAALAALETAEARRPFDLATGVVIRATLVRLAPERHSLLLTRHHIAGDGWSLGLLLGELSRAYRHLLAGTVVDLPPLPVQYGDFAAWERSRANEAAIERWVDRLRGASYGLDLLADPPDGAPPAPAAVRRATVPPAQLDRLRHIARAAGGTLFTVLLSAFGAALHRAGGQEDIVVGTPAAGRPRVQLEPVIGPFVAMLPLRLDLSGRSTFTALTRRTHEVVSQALDDRDVPVERLVDRLRPQRTLHDNPLFSAAFVFQNTPRAEVDLPGLVVSAAPSTPVMPKFALAVNATEADGGLDLELEYDDRRLPARSAGQVLDLFLAMLAGAAEDPDRPWPTLIPAPTLVRETAVDDAATTVHALVNAVAARQPDAVAVSQHGRQLSYGTLAARARRLAAALRARGVGAEDLVALCVEPSPDLVIGALAILTAGAGYLPIDVADPPARRAQLCADAGVRVVVTRRGLVDGAIPEVYVDEPATWTVDTPQRPAPVGPGNVAYAIYTSGSTGRPKGVQVPHAAITRLLGAAREAVPLLAGARASALTHSPAFDVSVFEMWSPLTAGHRLVMPRARLGRTPDELWRYLGEERVEVVCQTPSGFAQLAPVALRSGRFGALRAVWLAGEACDVSRFRAWLEAGGPQLFNVYGITETTVYTTLRPLDAIDARDTVSPLGRALPGQSVTVVGPHGDPVAPGARGELYIGGSGVARGYAGRPGLTADRFPPDPTASRPGARRYRSGDLVRLLPDGDLAYIGRIDNQIKLRGYRVEPGEVEAVLMTVPGVREAVVVANHQKLIGYVAVSDPALDESTLRDAVAGRLPRFMVPARIVLLDTLPVTRNGKVDRAALAARTIQASAVAADERPRTATERTLTAILAELIHLDEAAIGLRDSLFDLGGDSLTVTQLHARIVETFLVDPPVRRIYQALDVASLAAAVDGLREERERAAIEAALDEIEASGAEL